MSTRKKKRQKLAASSIWMRQNKWWMALGVVAFTLMVFLPSLQNDFVNWDDPDYILENDYIQEISKENIVHIATRPVAYNYHPLTMYSLMLDYSIWGKNAFGYHLMNLIIHLLNTLLIFYFAYLLSRGRVEIALITALLFGIHPMHVESVAWISERKDVLYVFFMTGSFIAYLKYLRKQNWSYYGVAIVLAALSMFSKPAAVVIPLLLICIDFYLKRKVRPKALMDKIPFFVLALIFGLMTIEAQTTGGGLVGKNFTIFQRISFVGYGFVMYLVKLIAPFNLAAFYPYPISRAQDTLPFIFNIMPLVALLIAAIVAWTMKYTRLIVFAFAFYFFNIALVLQFVSVGKAIIADRYTYMAYTGLFFAIAYYFHQFYHQNRAYQKPLQAGLGLVMFIFGVLSFQQTKVWENGETKWGNVIEKYPNSMVYTTRGDFYMNSKQFDKAFEDFTQAIALNPNEYDAHNLRGNIHRQEKRYTEAIADYRKALEIQPRTASAMLNLGNTYFETNKNDQAFKLYTTIIKGEPDNINALSNRGAIYFRQQKYDKALADLSKAISIDDDYFDAYMNRGVVYSVTNQFDKAIKDYNKCLTTQPNNLNILGFRALAYQGVQNHAAAVQDFSKMIQLRPKKADSYLNRSKSYFALGDKTLALKDATKARELGAAVEDAYWRALQ
ncbi:MAG: tetratricopeptide repeat protein [Chitinophagales bacterium]